MLRNSTDLRHLEVWPANFFVAPSVSLCQQGFKYMKATLMIADGSCGFTNKEQLFTTFDVSLRIFSLLK